MSGGQRRGSITISALSHAGLPRLYVPDGLAEGAAVQASPAQAHYLGAVLRRAVGDGVRLFNGRDGEWRARVASLRKERLVLEVEQLLHLQVAEPDCWLVFSLLKRDATDLVVQKATELGVSALVPVFSERCNAGRANLERLGAIAMEAAEQSERLSLPQVLAPRDLLAVLADFPTDRPLFAAVERVAGGRLAPLQPPGKAALLIGPEGGFSPRELDVLASLPFIQGVSFGPRILRAETAAIAGLALLLACP